MDSPYINTQLSTLVPLVPSQMNNNLYINLKNNLERKILKKCYRNFGFVSEIFEILEYKDGFIEAENLTSSATFQVTFSCKLCNPVQGSQIVGKVNRVNELFITVTNGPILTIITNENVNDEVFFTDNNNNLRYKDKDGKSKILKPNEFVKITIHAVTFNDGDDKIKTIGFLNGMGSDKEVMDYYQGMYQKSGDGAEGEDGGEGGGDGEDKAKKSTKVELADD